MKVISKNIIILIVAYFIYGISWSIITLLRYESFNAGVFDLGVASALLYSVFHQPFQLYYNGQPTMAMNKMIYLLMAPFFNLYPDPRLLLIFQSFFIPLAIFPIYGISKQVLNDEKISVIISLTYLFYYPMGGVNWFDFHYMSLVPTLFLTSFYFLLKKSYRLSIIFFILTDITNFLVPLIIIIFSIILFFTARNDKEKRISIFLIIFSTLLFTWIVMYFGVSYLTYWTNYHSISYYVLMIQTSTMEKVLYIFYIFLPVLFIPFLDRKYIYLIIPYLGFAFLNNYFPYIDPMFFQYPSLITPFIFLSLIYGLKELSNIKKIKIRSIKNIAIAILSINIALAIVLMPWGPLNSQVVCSYDLKDNIKVTQEDIALENIIKMIPKGSSVLIQDNMPQLCIGYNWTLPDFLKNNTLPEYIITDPYSHFFYNYSVYYPPYNQTMISLFNIFFMRGLYGIYAEYKGIILLKLNYSGSPLIFEPISMNLTVAKNNIQFLPPGNYSISSQDNVYIRILTIDNKIIYEGPAKGYFSLNIYYSDIKIEKIGNGIVRILQESP
jgi:uncharacterized membrane protein